MSGIGGAIFTNLKLNRGSNKEASKREYFRPSQEKGRD